MKTYGGFWNSMLGSVHHSYHQNTNREEWRNAVRSSVTFTEICQICTVTLFWWLVAFRHSINALCCPPFICHPSVCKRI